MEGIDRTENLSRVERAGSQQQRRRRMTDEEFKEYLEREKDNPGGGAPERDTEDKPESGAPDASKLGVDILDIRLRSVHDLSKIEQPETAVTSISIDSPGIEDSERPQEDEAEKPKAKPEKRIDTLV